MGLGDFFGGFAQILGPLGAMVPGGQALAAVAALGVKLSAGSGGEPIYYRPFADPALPKPYGMFARPAALVPSPRQKVGQPWKLARIVKLSPSPSVAALHVVYDDVDSAQMPIQWKRPIHTWTAKEAKQLAQELKIGAKPSLVTYAMKLAGGGKYLHPQLVLPMPPQDAYTHNIASVWTELAEIEVAKRLQLEGEDPSWAWYFSASQDATLFVGSSKNHAAQNIWSARRDPLGLEILEDQDFKGPSLAGTRLEDAADIAANMLVKVDAYRVTERQRIAELREFQAEVQTFAQSVVDAYKAGDISPAEWKDFLETTTGAAAAEIKPGGAPVDVSPFGMPTPTGPSPRTLLVAAAALVALFFIVRSSK